MQTVCVAQAVWHEARGESELGKRAVAHVIITRSNKRGLTPCQVIRERGQFDFRVKKSYVGADWITALKIARYPGLDPTNGASYFHNISIRPNWQRKRTAVIGRHIFYK
jgi:N-acetylmuramoyl-L-alanine amidase